MAVDMVPMTAASWPTRSDAVPVRSSTGLRSIFGADRNRRNPFSGIAKNVPSPQP
jgi:hypothetical protein